MLSYAPLAFVMSATMWPRAAHAQVAAVLSPTSEVRCEAGENVGVPTPDAQVASRIVCAEVLQRARAAHQAGPMVYRVHLGRLGTRVLLRITEYKNGVDVSDERQTALSGLEDVSSVGPTLAESLVSKRSFDSLATTENVLPEESQGRREKASLASIELGLVGTMFTGEQGSHAAPGLRGALSYHMNRNYLTLASRFGIAEDAFVLDATLGVGTHLTNGDVAPYLGAGVGYVLLSDQLLSTGHSGSGIAVYGEAGVGIFRTARTGLRVGLRADVPTFSMQGKRGWFASNSTPLPPNVYVVPLSLSVSLALF